MMQALPISVHSQSFTVQTKKNVQNSVLEHLRGRILRAELQPGIELRQETLAEEYGVSRMPVRDALTVLVKEGLATMLNRGGVAVSALTMADVRAVYELRASIDEYAIRAATLRATDAELAELDTYTRNAAAMSLTATIEVICQIDQQFHWEIYRLSGNAYVAKATESVWLQTRRIMNALFKADYHRPAWEQHREMMELMKARDAEGAAHAAREHMRRALEVLEKLLLFPPAATQAL